MVLFFRQSVDSMISGSHGGRHYEWTLMGSSFTRLPVLLTLIVTMGLGLSAAGAQTSSQSVTSGSGQYYVEFRSRQAWDYGHTFVGFGRVGETPGKKNGLPQHSPSRRLGLERISTQV
jgi:hypothetical protein